MPQRSCYSWVFTRNDMRRNTLRARRPRQDILTGLTGRALVMGDLLCEAGHSFNPELIPLGVPDPQHDIDVNENQMEPNVPHEMKDYQGWRISYRSKEPDRPQKDRFSKYMQAKFKHMADALTRLPECPRH
eukprot:1094220-Lingulodinium_polyedra.AAC.1